MLTSHEMLQLQDVRSNCTLLKLTLNFKYETSKQAIQKLVLMKYYRI